MKKLLKKVSFGIGLLLVCVAANAATISTNIVGTGAFLLTTNRASVYQIQLTSTLTGLVNFYDCDSLAAPYYGTNYVASSYVSRTSYSTNLVTSYVGSNGYTNYYTNAGIYTINVTNAAATNALPSYGAYPVAANTYTVADADMLFVRGIVAVATTNVSVVISYKPGQ